MSDRGERQTSSALPRVAVDFVLINLAFLLAYTIRVVYFFRNPSAEMRSAFVETSIELYTINVGLVVGLALGVFALFGVYTGRRFYAQRYKIVTILQATGVAGLSYVTLLFLVNRAWMPPRSVVMSTFVLVFAFCGGARYIKWQLERRYSITPRDDTVVADVSTVLIIGGAGHLGSVLCRRLLDDGYRVRCLDILMFGEGPVVELYNHERFEFYEGDFRNVETVVKAIKGTDAVVHLGAIVGDPACAVDEDYSVDVNYAATRMIREVCRGFGVRRFVFASTCSVYGASDHVLDEHSRLNPVSLYAQTKIDSEKAILSLHDDTFSPTVLRLATVFGLSPRPRFDLAVNIVTAMAVREGKCRIFGGDQWRPFIHTTDVARAVSRVLRARESVVAGQIYNVGDDRLNMQLSEIGDLVEQLIPDAEVVRDTTDVDPRNYRVSFKKVRDQLGFTCETSLENGMGELVEAIRSGQIDNFRDPLFSNLNYLKRLRDAGHPSARIRESQRIRALKPA